MSTLVHCYNKGCLKKFDPSKNTPDSCLFHPGEPVFHDAYKSWSCCSKKTTDFTEFLNIQGCTRSYHQDKKPQEPVKPVVVQLEETTRSNPIQKPVVPMERPDENDPMVRLPCTTGASLVPLLSKLSVSKNEEIPEKNGDGNITVTIGTSCKNAGCKKSYQDERSNRETCLYHSGQPIFHEGMKYWTCCQRKTSDFSSFLEQEGCTTGNHTWIKEKNEATHTACRFDWHQTGSFVVITIFSKLPIPDLSVVEANRVKVRMYITFGEQKNVFEETLVLTGVINVEKSSVQFLGTKTEIQLKKAEPVSWKYLYLPKAKPKEADQDSDCNLDDD
ncbi:cysteine and histidine-rich domain-containing protein 1-like isoform X2 [Ornithodoros turicata]